MEKQITKEYSNGELTIVWKPQVCIHAGECVKALPDVYKPKEKPWINAEHAKTQDLINQIDKCPSGALSYYIPNKNTKAKAEQTVKVNVSKNGPILINGECELIGPDGSSQIISKNTALCRCGASKNKPYCDGSHKTIAFIG
jgi:uncharacterized Fe-S cluster protein YjdI